jgi:hypothetical protein
MTYRDQFGKMPPLKHDKTIASSEVVIHISQAMACDIERANKLFNELRKRRIIVFDKLDRTWHGIDNRSIRHTASNPSKPSTGSCSPHTAPTSSSRITRGDA